MSNDDLVRLVADLSLSFAKLCFAELVVFILSACIALLFCDVAGIITFIVLSIAVYIGSLISEA